MESGIFKTQFYSSLKLGGPFIPIIGKPLSKILAIDAIDNCYQRSLESPGENFSEQILNALNISLSFKQEDLLHIPKQGSAIILANHPFGGIEGVLISALLEKIRPDIKIMANYFLKAIPELVDKFIFVDPFNSDKSANRNLGPMREAIRWVKNDGLLVVFPAGAVSHYHIKNRTVTDPAWKENIGKLIERVQAPVTPVFFEGHNNLIFQTLGMIHPGLRSARLPYEFVNKANRSFTIFIGKSTPVGKLKHYPTAQDKLDYFRKRTYNLANHTKKHTNPAVPKFNAMQPIPPEFPIQELQSEVEQIPKQQILFEQKDALVFYVHRSQIPVTMQEIGRQRETTFRAVGEGTGHALDLDRYDDYYIHLIAWNRKDKRIIGAYRLGLADQILRDFGPDGLYTSSLFRIKQAYFNSISPALELGRSFITQEYQRSFSSLFLLWRGIGAFVSLHPHYRYLFGPVSISNTYQPYSQKMMLGFLKAQHSNPQLSKMVSAKNPDTPLLKKFSFSNKEATYLSELEDMIADLEDDFSGIPVLIRQYLKMGAKFISFNRDEDFNSALDGLIVVDLCKSEPKLIHKYFGTAGAQSFNNYHAIRNHL